jgi:hypothetical protein
MGDVIPTSEGSCGLTCASIHFQHTNGCTMASPAIEPLVWTRYLSSAADRSSTTPWLASLAVSRFSSDKETRRVGLELSELWDVPAVLSDD